MCSGCGYPMSDFLHRDGQPDPQLSLNYAVCTACVAKERALAVQNKRDDMVEKSGGIVYRSARRWLMRIINTEKG